MGWPFYVVFVIFHGIFQVPTMLSRRQKPGLMLLQVGRQVAHHATAAFLEARIHLGGFEGPEEDSLWPMVIYQPLAGT